MDENKNIYRRARVAHNYRKTAKLGLLISEKVCFDLVPPSKRGSILDIGIGAGRTVGPLAEMFEKYVGIDYSREMIEAARRQFPDKDLRVMDARKLSFDENFDCVMFSFNGIDYVSYADRQLILREVVTKLRRGGTFIYSTHNFGYPRAAVWMNCFWVKELLLRRRQLLRPQNQVRIIINRLRNFRRQSTDDVSGIAYVNDPGLSFQLVTAYVDIPQELETLRRCGFCVLTTIGNTKQLPGHDANDNWVYVVAQKT